MADVVGGVLACAMGSRAKEVVARIVPASPAGAMQVAAKLADGEQNMQRCG